MTCNKNALAAVASVIVAAFDTLTAVAFTRRKKLVGFLSAICSAGVQIIIMPYIDAHLIAAVAAISIPATIYIANPTRLHFRAKAGIACILIAIPIGFGARSRSEDRTCPHERLVAGSYISATLFGIVLGAAAAAGRERPKLLPVVDGIMGAATTLSAELVAVGTWQALFPLATHGSAALAAAAASLERNTAAYHVPISYAVWMAGVLLTDLAVGHNINLRYAIVQTLFSALGVTLVNKYSFLQSF